MTRNLNENVLSGIRLLYRFLDEIWRIVFQTLQTRCSKNSTRFCTFPVISYCSRQADFQRQTETEEFKTDMGGGRSLGFFFVCVYALDAFLSLHGLFETRERQDHLTSSYIGTLNSPKFVSLRPENNSFLNVRKRFYFNKENLLAKSVTLKIFCQRKRFRVVVLEGVSLFCSRT